MIKIYGFALLAISNTAFGIFLSNSPSENMSFLGTLFLYGNIFFALVAAYMLYKLKTKGLLKNGEITKDKNQK